MSIKIDHLQKSFWIESKILENCYDSEGKPLPINGKRGSIESEVKKFAIKKAIEENPVLTKKTAPSSDTYRFIIGAMMEVLSEFYIKLFELSNFNLQLIEDTSDEKYQRGYDFIGKAGPLGDIDVQIQIKWRDDSKHLFTKKDLHTMVDEAEKAEIRNKNVWLVVVSSTEMKGYEVLSWKDEFKANYLDRFRIITGKIMEYKIARLQSSRKLSGFEEFWTLFKESLEMLTV